MCFILFWISFTCAHNLLYQGGMEILRDAYRTVQSKSQERLCIGMSFIHFRACYVNARVCVIYLQIYWYVIVLLKWINYCSFALTARRKLFIHGQIRQTHARLQRAVALNNSIKHWKNNWVTQIARTSGGGDIELNPRHRRRRRDPHSKCGKRGWNFLSFTPLATRWPVVTLTGN